MDWVRSARERARSAADRDRRLRRYRTESPPSPAVKIAKSLAIFFSILALVHLINQAKIINEFGVDGGDIFHELRPEYD